MTEPVQKEQEATPVRPPAEPWAVATLFAGILVPPVALVTGFMAWRRHRADPTQGGWLYAIIGMVLGVMTVLALLMVWLNVRSISP